MGAALADIGQGDLGAPKFLEQHHHFSFLAAVQDELEPAPVAALDDRESQPLAVKGRNLFDGVPGLELGRHHPDALLRGNFQ